MDPEQKKKVIMGAVASVAIIGVGVGLMSYYGVFGGGGGAPMPQTLEQTSLGQTEEGKKDLAETKKIMESIEKKSVKGGS
jgi:hypothetical protein